MKKKIKKFGGGALSAVDSKFYSKFFYVLFKDKDLVLNPELSVRKMGDDIMDPKQTISSKSLGIEKGFDVGRVGAKIYKSDVKYDSIPVPPTSTKGIEGSFILQVELVFMVVMKNHKQVNLKDLVLLQELDLKLNLTKVDIQLLTKTILL
jgi:hypothetical protein